MNIILVILQVRKTTHNYPRILFRKCLPPPVCVNFVQIHNRLLSFFLVIVIINMVCDCFSLLLSTLADSDASSWEAKGACFLRVHWFQFKPSLGHGEWEGTNLGERVREIKVRGGGRYTAHNFDFHSTAPYLLYHLLRRCVWCDARYLIAQGFVQCAGVSTVENGLAASTLIQSLKELCVSVCVCT